MGVIVSRLTKPIKTFNIEQRAQKILDRQKPIPSPVYPSTIEQLKISKEVNPNFMENHNKKDSKLDERLKHVFVSSHMKQADMNNEQSQKSMPQRRTSTEEYNYGYWEPAKVSIGRCYLRTALEFMGKHTSQPEVYTAETIASEYNLNLKDVENVLEYYRVFQVIQNDTGLLVEPIKADVKGEIENK